MFAGGVAADTAFVDSVVEWLTESCGLRAAPAGHAPTALVSARNYLFAVSPAALQAESFVMLMQSASREVGEYAGLRLVALVREGVSDRELPPFLADHAVVHAGSAGLTPDIALQILEALYPDPPGVHGAPETVQDVYFTRSWIDDPMESEPADWVCSRASGLGFRLIGDTEDPEFDPVVRLPKIMAGCGASIAVLPYRDGLERTSPWMLEELRLAREAGLPCVIAKDPRVALSRDVADAPNVVALVDTLTSEDWTTRLDSALQSLAGHWRTPANPADVLYLTDGNRPVETARTLVRRMTAMALTTLDRPLPDRETLLEVVREADLVLVICPVQIAKVGSRPGARSRSAARSRS